MKILIWPGSTEIGREVVRSLKQALDMDVLTAGTADSIYLAPVSDPAWRMQLHQRIAWHGIDYVYPAHDAVQYALTEAPEVPSIMPSAETVRTCRSKRATYAALRDLVAVPRVFVEDVPTYPVFVKPDAGQGSRGASKVDCADELPGARRRAGNDHLVLEYLPGPEFTVDCFSTGGELRWHQVRRRTAVRNGISVDTERVDNMADLAYWARVIGERLRMRGAWFFQVKLRANGAPVLLEVAPRIPGGAGLARVRGVNLPLLTVLEFTGQPVQITEFDTVRRMTRHLADTFA